MIGDDQPRAILRRDGTLEALGITNGPQSSKEKYRDVVITGLGSVFTLTSESSALGLGRAELMIDDGIFKFDSLDDLMTGKAGTQITHPAFDLSQQLSLHATESRVLLFSKGALPHLFELKQDQHGQTSVLLIDDLEGLAVETVIAGYANRLAVITASGDAYLIPKASRVSIEVEPIELEDDSGVRLVGVGAKFEVMITGENVWVRGDSESCLLPPGPYLVSVYFWECEMILTRQTSSHSLVCPWPLNCRTRSTEQDHR